MLFRGIQLAGLIALACTTGCGGCSSEGFPVDASPPDAVTLGRVSLAWSLTDLAGQPITCDQVGAKTVSLAVRNQAGASGTAASFSCTNSPSVTQFFASGLYSIAFELNGDSGTLATASDQNNVLIAGGQITPLTPVVFPVDAKGSVALSIATPPGASNCKSPPMGAGITSMTITLVNAGGSCAPVTLLRARGTTSLGSYTVDCGSPQTATCIESDETLTPAAPLPSGPYTIHIRGKVGGAECWRNDDALQVPPQAKVLVRTLNLANGC
jgi:hypothetical protein